MINLIFSLNKKKLIPIVILLLLFFIFISNVFALGVDEKLSLRILNVSESKKTVLINRGIEDGLANGDHAKFFLTDGVFARGVLIEISPSRSVWSLYRIADENQITSDKMANLKITPKVKLTTDPTKMLAATDAGSSGSKGESEEIVLEGAEENHSNGLDKGDDGEDLAEGTEGRSGIDDEDKEFVQREISSANFKEGKGGVESGEVPEGSAQVKDSLPVAALKGAKTWEVWGTLHLNAFNSTNSTGVDGAGTKGDVQTIDLMMAFEKYFANFNSWYGRFSLYPFVHFYKQEATSVEGNKVSNDILGYGAGFNWHFLAPPISVGQMIGFVGANYGIGNAKDVTLVRIGNENEQIPLTGKAQFFSVGGGIKYYIMKGFGLKALLDYYHRGEVYSIEGKDDPYTKKVSGPRLLLGLSYRW